MWVFFHVIMAGWNFKRAMQYKAMGWDYSPPYTK